MGSAIETAAEIRRAVRAAVCPTDIENLIPWPMHEGQLQAWRSDKRFIAIIAGTQSGKTSWGPWWLAREIQRTQDKKATVTGNDYLAVSATYDLFKLKMLPEMLRTFCEEIGGWTWRAGDGVLEGPNNCRIILRSATAKGGLESNTAKAAWLDECGQDEFPLMAWEAVQRRLSLSQGRVLLTTTPYNLGWLKCEVFDRWVGGHPDYDVIQFKSTMNPAFPLTEYERAREVLPTWKFEMFYNGNFTRPAGLIYGDFDESKHLVRPFSIPDKWIRDVGVDFGGTEHTALLWIAEDPSTGNYYIYREVVGGGMTGAEHARAAVEYGEPVKLALGGAKSEEEHRQTWRNCGLPVNEPYISEVEAGIDRVVGLFKRNRLFVFDTLYGLRAELGTYSRELDDAGEPTMKIKDKEKFHRLDALRYICSAFPLKRPTEYKEREERKRKAGDPVTGY